MSDADKIFKWSTITMEQSNTMTFVERSWADWSKQYTIEGDKAKDIVTNRLKVISDDRESLHAMIAEHHEDHDYLITVFARKAPYIKSIVLGVDVMIDIDKIGRAFALAKGAIRRMHVKGLNSAVWAEYGKISEAQANLDKEERRFAKDPERLAMCKADLQKTSQDLTDVLEEILRWSGLEKEEKKDGGSTTSLFT